MSFIYIASPYSDPDPSIMQSRFETVEKFVAEQLNQSNHVYSPIVHCHVIAEKYELPITYEFWENYNKAMLSKASIIWVLTMDGWNYSNGVNDEMLFANQCGIPIEYKDLK